MEYFGWPAYFLPDFFFTGLLFFAGAAFFAVVAFFFAGAVFFTGPAFLTVLAGFLPFTVLAAFFGFLAAVALGAASRGISLAAFGEPRPVQASQPGPESAAARVSE